MDNLKKALETNSSQTYNFTLRVCSMCGNHFYDYSMGTAVPGICPICANASTISIKSEGWICPVCGRGVSPYEKYCDCQTLSTKS